jgi:hypothetical protein
MPAGAGRRLVQPGQPGGQLLQLTEDSVEMGFLTDDPVAQAVTCQRVTFDARAPHCGRYVCATAGRVNWT